MTQVEQGERFPQTMHSYYALYSKLISVKYVVNPPRT